MARVFTLLTAAALIASLFLAGCLSDGLDPSSTAEAQTTNETVSWSASAETAIGCMVGAGHYTGGLYSYACVAGEDYEPCSQVRIPDGAEALSFAIEPEPVDIDAPGAGEYAISVFGPPDAEWKQAWMAPIGEVSFEVEDPEPGTWGVNAIAQGATVSQAWDVTAEASGQAAAADVPEIVPGSCT